MARLSVIIPSRQEKYLYPTIRDCFSKAAGEVEVVVHLDGYWPSDWKTMTDAYPNLHTVHSGEAVGMRPGINKAAGSAISRGAKYLFKLDAHCMLDEGYDTKLIADMDDDWIVVPRRKRLDAENWTLQDVGKPDIDYHYLSFPNDPDDWGGPGLNGKPWTQRILDRRDKPEFDVDDEMSSQGSAWACHAEYFTQLELMDTDSYGPFWNEFQEIGLKCWLSGGKVKVNKKTWYAHLRKGKEYEGADGKKGRGYTLPEAWLTKGRNHTMSWIYNEAWNKQTLPFSWLIEHFWPVPTWPDNWEEVLYATRKPRDVSGTVQFAVPSGTQEGDVIVGHVERLNGGLEILEAHYGVGGDDVINVKDELRRHIRNDSLDIVVNNSTLTPGQNPFRGKKKKLWVTYCWNSHGEPITVEREEKDWLIIGPLERQEPLLKCAVCGGLTPSLMAPTSEANVGVCSNECADEWVKGHVKPTRDVATVEEISNRPMSAAALNDYLIRRFSISPQRLRGPMPIELRDFHRNDLAQLFAELGFRRGAEIGVAEGLYSEVLMKANPTMELLCVDPWHSYSGNPQNKTKEKNEYAYNEAKRRLCQPDWHVKLIPAYSMDAVRDVEDSSLDMVYIDGHHSYPYVMADIIEWTKKVRSGGIVALDDVYRIDEARWGAGPMEAIYDYTRAMRINPWWLIAAHKSVDAFFVKQ